MQGREFVKYLTTNGLEGYISQGKQEKGIMTRNRKWQLSIVTSINWRIL